MPTFDLPAAAYEMIVGQLEASIERRRRSERSGFADVPAIGAAEERALRAAQPVDGGWRITCDEACRRGLAGWFEQMALLIDSTRRNFADPGHLMTICGEAASTIRRAAA